MGQVEHPEVKAAINRVTAVCQDANMPLGIFGVSAAAVHLYIDRGYRLIVTGTDTLLLAQSAAQLLAEMKS